MGIAVTLNEERIKEKIAQKIADYWDGREITVSGGVGAHWSDFEYIEVEQEVTDPDTGESTTETVQKRERVKGTHDSVSAITGIIHATANGANVNFTIEYFITISNIG